MTVEEAERELRIATWEEQGTFVQLRLGIDPGAAKIATLRLALRVIWRHWKSFDALRYDIAAAAAMILFFESEACRNLQDSGQPLRDRLLTREIPDLVQGAFELLSGRDADSWTVRRKDLGE